MMVLKMCMNPVVSCFFAFEFWFKLFCFDVGLFICILGGHFLCKLFDVFTPFSVGCVYLMYRAFKHVCIFKPVTSRPANSERYVELFS